ncbi:unnamed protein product [Albugo candida]|uniref:Uncharacterized protein n=1 Tax=Albugo candida TaxID=65357 RepID=A0A024G1X5_9STRA|nr:unnamed protein product [Albugo candida]|eukprot:CCI40308.1 unnamed protein product [Albugo candida]
MTVHAFNTKKRLISFKPLLGAYSVSAVSTSCCFLWSVETDYSLFECSMVAANDGRRLQSVAATPNRSNRSQHKKLKQYSKTLKWYHHIGRVPFYRYTFQACYLIRNRIGMCLTFHSFQLVDLRRYSQYFDPHIPASLL